MTQLTVNQRAARLLPDTFSSIARRFFVFGRASSFKDIQSDTNLPSHVIADQLASDKFKPTFDNNILHYTMSNRGILDIASQSISPFDS